MVDVMRMRHTISLIAAGVLFSWAAFGSLPAAAESVNPLKQLAFSASGQSVAPQLADAKAAPRRENGDMVMGAPDAPVTVIEYASLTCPHCARFHSDTLPKLKSTYIDAGVVKYVFRDFPLDRLALSAAMIAQCAGAERYFNFLDVLFKQQANWAKGKEQDAMAALKRLARLGGMSDAQIDACLANKEVQDRILATSVAGQNQFQVRSTPTLIINGERHGGALSFEELDKIIKPLAGKS